MSKRGYSRAFTPRSETYGRYLLDKVPATLWSDVRAKCKREGISVRGLILSLLKAWLDGPAPEARKVPKQFTMMGLNKCNAEKAWLDGFDAATTLAQGGGNAPSD